MRSNLDATSGLRIAYVVSMNRGLQSFVHREVRELVALGVEVHLLPTKVGSGPYMPEHHWPVHRYDWRKLVRSHARMFSQDPIRYGKVFAEAFRYGALLDFAFAVFCADVVESNDLRVIHCHFGDHKLFSGYFCARLSHRPISVTLHAYELYLNPNPGLFRRILGRVDAIVTVSDYNREALARWHDVPKERVHVIRLFADLPEKYHFPTTQDCSGVVLNVARFVEKKGHRTLFTALSQLPPEISVWLVGNGPLDISELARTCGVQDRVRILGEITDRELERLYESATVFCLPSEVTKSGDREGIPVSLMEAMAHGLPVVATRHSGIPELVDEILVEEGDAKGIADAILRVIRDPSLRERQGRKNRSIVETRYSRGNVLLLKALFERLANETAARTRNHVAEMGTSVAAKPTSSGREAR